MMPISITRGLLISGTALPIIVALLGGAAAAPAYADFKDDVGYTQLVNSLALLGIPVPNGNGVPVSLVESTQDLPGQGIRSYRPNPSFAEFTETGDPLSQAVSFIDASNNTCTGGACISFSNHATQQASTMIGNASGLAPGANQMTLYEANNFLTSVLRVSMGGTPLVQNFRVQNFSWVGSYQNVNDDVSALRRFDFMIDRDNVTAVVGINNNIDPLPNLLGQSFNSIAVGKTNGVHSSGLTTLAAYGPGRSKPDIVAPQTTTSQATSTVSSAATVLHGVVGGTDGAKSEVMKAMLMAGATKTEFPSWTRTTSQPLDDTFGAGELNVFNSYLMTQGGQFDGNTGGPTIVGSHGWDYGNAVPGAGNELKYKFIVPEGKTAPDLSIILTWNVSVAAGLASQSLANFNMSLTNSLGQTVDQSLSSVDNVEHIYLQNLTSGDYTLTISTDAARDFGLAWRLSTLYDVATADFDADGDVDGRDFLTWQRGFGKLINAGLSDGDADGDGDVDAADLTIYQAQFSPGVVDPPALVLAAVPEPGSALLLASAVLAFALKRRR